MEENSRLLRVQANRLLVGDEMHFVAALRQLDSALGAHNAAAAIGGITGDAYFHQGRSISRSGWMKTYVSSIKDRIANVSAHSLIQTIQKGFTMVQCQHKESPVSSHEQESSSASSNQGWASDYAPSVVRSS